jgi:hypothetical protein
LALAACSAERAQPRVEPVRVEVRASSDAGAPAAQSPRGVASVAAAVGTTSAPIADAERVVASAQPRLRECYDAGLRRDPAMVGTLDVTIHVGAKGGVTAIEARRRGLSEEVESCAGAALRALAFAAPSPPGDAYVVASMKFSFPGSADPELAPNAEPPQKPARGGTSIAATVGTTSAPIAGVEHVVLAAEPRLRACQSAAMRAGAGARARVAATVHVAADGSVARVTPSFAEGVADSVTRCFVTTLESLRFARPAGAGEAYVVVSATFE